MPERELGDVAWAGLTAEWVEWFRDKDVCFAPVQDLAEAYRHPQTRAREMVLEDEPGRPSFEYPEHGGQSDEILRSLGYAERELAAMKEKGVY